MTAFFVTSIAIAVAAAILYGAVRLFRQRRDVEDALFDLSPPDVQVLSRTRVGIGRTLVVVEVEGRRLLLGSTREQWCALADLGSTGARASEEILGGIDAELARAIQATRYRRGWKHS